MAGSTVAIAAATILALLLLVIMAIPWALLLRQTEYYKNDWPLRYRRTFISDIYPELHTGDIVLFAPQVTILSPFTMSMFTHASMVLRERSADGDRLNDAVSIVETSVGTPPGSVSPSFSIPTGVAITPFLAKIKYYPGPAFVIHLKQPLTEDQEERIIETAYGMLGDPYPSLGQAVVDIARGRSTPHCYQLVATLLHSAGLDMPSGPSLSGGYSALTICDAVRSLSNEKNYLISKTGTVCRYNEITEMLYDI